MLLEGLWHTTHPDRFSSILNDGAILPEPLIPENARWTTRDGPKHHPFVRTLGGVSLFDFASFNEAVYSENYPVSNWQYFVPYRSDWRSAIWIEIDRSAVAANLISPSELLRRWKAEEAFGHRIMPQLESAHLGRIPVGDFKRVLMIRGDAEDIKQIL